MIFSERELNDIKHFKRRQRWIMSQREIKTRKQYFESLGKHKITKFKDLVLKKNHRMLEGLSRRYPKNVNVSKGKV